MAFSFAISIKHGGIERTQLIEQEPNRQHVVDQPRQLGHNHPNILGPFRNLYAGQFLDGDNIAKVVRHGTDVVETVRERDSLHVSPLFADFLNTPM